MANETSQVLQTLRALLLADSTLTGKVSRRVRTAHVGDSDVSTLEYPFVICAPLGGLSMSNRHVMSTSFEVYVYSKVSVSEALSAYEDVYRILQSSRLFLSGLGPRGIIRETERPREGYNDRTLSHYVRATYEVLSAG